MVKKKQTKKELEHMIELLDEYLADTDGVYLDLQELQAEYKKRFGKEYEY